MLYVFSKKAGRVISVGRLAQHQRPSDYPPSLIICICLSFACLLLSACGACQNTPLEQVLSPDAKYRAVVFERSCGATTDFSQQISIVSAQAQLPDESGNAFVAQGIADGALDVKWVSRTKIEITYPKSATVYLNQPGVEIMGNWGHKDNIEIVYNIID
jgi:hypothetical protein